MLIKYKIISALVPTVGAGIAVAFYLTRSKNDEVTVSSEVNDEPMGEVINGEIDGGKKFRGTTSKFGGMKKFEIGSRETLEKIKQGQAV